MLTMANKNLRKQRTTVIIETGESTLMQFTPQIKHINKLMPNHIQTQKI